MTLCAKLWPHGEGCVWSEPRRERLSRLLSPRVSAGGTLGLSKVFNSQDLPEPPQRAARGTSGLTTLGRKVLRSASVLLERNEGRRCLTFCTVTLPPHVLKEFRAREHWSEITRRFVQSVSEKLSRSGLPSHVFGCTEIQPKRAASGEGVPLHLHLCFKGRPPRGRWQISTSWVERAWRIAVEGVVSTAEAGKKSLWKASTQLAAVRKSVGSYLGKYLSKGALAVSSYGAEGLPVDSTPASWFVCTRQLRRLVARETLSGSFLGEWLEALVEERSPLVAYWSRPQVLDKSGCPCKSFLYVCLRDSPGEGPGYNEASPPEGFYGSSCRES